MSFGFLVRVATSIVDTTPSSVLATKTVVPSGVTSSPDAPYPFGLTGMSVGFLVRVATSIVDTEPSRPLATNTVFPSGVIAMPPPPRPIGMSVGYRFRVLTSTVDTAACSFSSENDTYELRTKTVARHRARAAGTAAALPFTELTTQEAPTRPSAIASAAPRVMRANARRLMVVSRFGSGSKTRDAVAIGI